MSSNKAYDALLAFTSEANWGKSALSGATINLVNEVLANPPADVAPPTGRRLALTSVQSTDGKTSVGTIVDNESRLRSHVRGLLQNSDNLICVIVVDESTGEDVLRWFHHENHLSTDAALWLVP